MPQKSQQSSSSLEFALWRSQVEFGRHHENLFWEGEYETGLDLNLDLATYWPCDFENYLGFWALPEKLSETNKTHTWTGNGPPEAIAVTHFLCIFQKWSM